MIDCNSLPERLREICTGSAVKSDGTQFSAEDRAAIVGRRLRRQVLPDELPNAPAIVRSAKTKADTVRIDISTIGTELKKVIRRETGADIPCPDCQADINKLNTMTAAEVQKVADKLAQTIVDRGKTKARKWHQRIAATVVPGAVKTIVRGWIDEACRLGDAKVIGHVPRYLAPRYLAAHKNHRGGDLTESGVPILAAEQSQDVPEFLRSHQKTWSYGVTTVAWRIPHLRQTLASLSQAGWDRPTLFIDGNEQPAFAEFRYEKVFRARNAKPFANWLLSLSELFLRNPECDRYAIFQDDVLFVRNLRQYLDSCEYPEQGYWNLFSFYENEPLLSRTPSPSWLRSNQKGQGGLALVFSNEAVVHLLSQGHMYRRAMSYGHKYAGRQFKCLDGAIVEAMRSSGWAEWIHNPSLVQHTGHKSSMGNKPHPPAKTFPGESFDASRWIE